MRVYAFNINYYVHIIFDLFNFNLFLSHNIYITDISQRHLFRRIIFYILIMMLSKQKNICSKLVFITPSP